MSDAPRPPYAAGQAMPHHPASQSRRCQRLAVGDPLVERLGLRSRWIGLEPGAQVGAEALLVGGVRQVHCGNASGVTFCQNHASGGDSSSDSTVRSILRSAAPLDDLVAGLREPVVAPIGLLASHPGAPTTRQVGIPVRHLPVPHGLGQATLRQRAELVAPRRRVGQDLPETSLGQRALDEPGLVPFGGRRAARCEGEQESGAQVRCADGG